VRRVNVGSCCCPERKTNPLCRHCCLGAVSYRVDGSKALARSGPARSVARQMSGWVCVTLKRGQVVLRVATAAQNASSAAVISSMIGTMSG
jgi:hypothetical protein